MRPSRVSLALCCALFVAGEVGCGPSLHIPDYGAAGADDLSMDVTLPDDAGSDVGSGDGGGGGSCSPKMGDLVECSCSGTMSRACWPVGSDPKNRGVGACKDGMQACTANGEFSTWGNCTGAVLPAKELCSDKIDNDCNGLIDCKDPACATNPACLTGCINGQMRACYDGPVGTINVGICRGGMQTCANGTWPMSCPGEVLPTKENCGDGLDHNCNHLPGCLDLFSCALDPACQPQCKLDNGCVCPMGSGETATCPDGFRGITKNANIFSAGTVECCPCTANDCGDPQCCAEAACKGNKLCGPFTCKPLPMGCNGKVGFDCDDFTEDCDVMCCKCTQGC